MPSTQSEPTTYFSAWQRIKREEHCSTVEAMRRAQDRFPELYEKFMEICPRLKR